MPRAVGVNKCCTMCGVWKNVSEFYRRRSATDGLASNCKMCGAELTRMSKARKLVADPNYRKKVYKRARELRLLRIESIPGYREKRLEKIRQSNQKNREKRREASRRRYKNRTEAQKIKDAEYKRRYTVTQKWMRQKFAELGMNTKETKK